MIKDKYINKDYKILILLSAVVLLLYARTFWFGFSPMDEQWLLVRNTEFMSDWASFIKSFSIGIQGIYYRPILLLSLLIDFKISGMDPMMFHISNTVYHILASFMLFKVLMILGTDRLKSFYLSALYAVHPMMVNGVAWIPGRNDVLLCFFTLVSIYFLMKYFKGSEKKYLFGHLIFFLIALFTKESAASLPVFFILFFLIQKGYKSELVKLSLTWILTFVTWYFLRSHFVDFIPVPKAGLLDTLRDLVLTFLGYTGKSLLPFVQSVAPPLRTVWIWPGLFTLALMALILYKKWISDTKAALTGVALFFSMMIFPVWFGANSQWQIQDEHRAITSIAGLMMLISAIRIPTVFNDRFKVQFAELSNRSINLVLIVLVLYTLKTYIRLETYRNEDTYAEEGVVDCPENFNFHAHMANSLYGHQMFADAIIHFNQAIKMRPNLAQLYHNRANAFLEIGKKDSCLMDFNKAAELSNNNPQVLVNRMKAYRRFKEYQGAFRDLELINRLFPGTLPPNYGAEMQKEYLDLRFVELNKMIAKEPKNALLFVNRAQFFMEIRNPEYALKDLQYAVELDPTNAEYKKYLQELQASYSPKK